MPQARAVDLHVTAHPHVRMQLMEAQATFGFTDKEKDQYLAGVLPAGFFLVGAPAAVVVRSWTHRMLHCRSPSLCSQSISPPSLSFFLERGALQNTPSSAGGLSDGQAEPSAATTGLRPPWRSALHGHGVGDPVLAASHHSHAHGRCCRWYVFAWPSRPQRCLTCCGTPFVVTTARTRHALLAVCASSFAVASVW